MPSLTVTQTAKWGKFVGINDNGVRATMRRRELRERCGGMKGENKEGGGRKYRHKQYTITAGALTMQPRRNCPAVENEPICFRNEFKGGCKG